MCSLYLGRFGHARVVHSPGYTDICTRVQGCNMLNVQCRLAQLHCIHQRLETHRHTWTDRHTRHLSPTQTHTTPHTGWLHTSRDTQTHPHRHTDTHHNTQADYSRLETHRHIYTHTPVCVCREGYYAPAQLNSAEIGANVFEISWFFSIF